MLHAFDVSDSIASPALFPASRALATGPVRLDYLAEVLDHDVQSHWGMAELRAFGANLKRRPLDRDRLRVFFSSLVAFVGDIPGGILALALRVTDDWIDRDPLNATARGAAVLFAAADEYGLHDMQSGLQRTHHQLFIDVIRHWGMSPAELMNSAYVLSEGAALGRRTADYYRWRSIPEALGFHFASEATSSIEFGLYLDGFKTFEAEYGFTGLTDPALTFFVIHTEVEPGHRDAGLRMIKLYMENGAQEFEAVRAGVRSFMEGYGQLFAALNRDLFGG